MVIEGKRRATRACFYLMVQNVAQLIGTAFLVNLFFEDEKKIEIDMVAFSVGLLGSPGLGLVGTLMLWQSLKLCERNRKRASTCVTWWFYLQVGSCCLALIILPVGITLIMEFFFVYLCCVAEYREGLKDENNQPQFLSTNPTTGGVVGLELSGLKRVPINGYLPPYPGTGFQ